jgi:hypothetical protein
MWIIDWAKSGAQFIFAHNRHYYAAPTMRTPRLPRKEWPSGYNQLGLHSKVAPATEFGALDGEFTFF